MQKSYFGPFTLVNSYRVVHALAQTNLLWDQKIMENLASQCGCTLEASLSYQDIGCRRTETTHQQRVGRSESHCYWTCYWRMASRLSLIRNNYVYIWMNHWIATKHLQNCQTCSKSHHFYSAYSKCPPSAWTQARSRWRPSQIACSITSWFRAAHSLLVRHFSWSISDILLWCTRSCVHTTLYSVHPVVRFRNI